MLHVIEGLAHFPSCFLGKQEQEEGGVCSGCRAEIFLLFPPDDLSASSHLRHYILSGARAHLLEVALLYA